jgi:cardiolipin synthase
MMTTKPFKPASRWVFPVLSVMLVASCGVQPQMAPMSSEDLFNGAARDAAFNDDGPSLQEAPRESFQLPVRPMRNPNPRTQNNAASLSVGPRENVPALEALIKSAKKTLYLETFNFGNDSMGQRVVPLLKAKAKEGVEVKVLADYVGSRFLPGAKAMAVELRAAGVDFRYYPIRGIRKDDKRLGANITHRKLYLADGDRGLVGGMNLMADFDTKDQDVLIDFRGEAAQQFHGEFARDWKLARGGDLVYPGLQPGMQYGAVDAAIFVTSAPEGRFEARGMTYRAIERAQAEIVIEQQYLTDDGVLTRLDSALRRGVKVKAIVPGESSSKVFMRLHTVKLNALGKLGAEFRLYNGNPSDAHVHTKYMAVDGNWATVGSTNHDTRALFDNQEISLATSDRGLIEGLRTRLFDHDWNNATKVFEFKEYPWYELPFNRLLDIFDYYL